MKTAIKRVVMWLYCRELISASTTLRIFAKFELWGA